MTLKSKDQRRKFDDLPLPQQAGILCNEPQFQMFVASRLALPDGEHQVTSGAAAEFLRQWCRINSRASLAYTPDAARRFATLRTEFDAWRGKIPPQS